MVAFSLRVYNHQQETVRQILLQMSGTHWEIYAQRDSIDPMNYTIMYLVYNINDKYAKQRTAKAISQYHSIYNESGKLLPNFINPKKTLWEWGWEWNFYQERPDDPDSYR